MFGLPMEVVVGAGILVVVILMLMTMLARMIVPARRRKAQPLSYIRRKTRRRDGSL